MVASGIRSALDAFGDAALHLPTLLEHPSGDVRDAAAAVLDEWRRAQPIAPEAALAPASTPVPGDDTSALVPPNAKLQAGAPSAKPAASANTSQRALHGFAATSLERGARTAEAPSSPSRGAKAPLAAEGSAVLPVAITLPRASPKPPPSPTPNRSSARQSGSGGTAATDAPMGGPPKLPPQIPQLGLSVQRVTRPPPPPPPEDQTWKLEQGNMTEYEREQAQQAQQVAGAAAAAHGDGSVDFIQITTGLGADGADPVRAKSHANRVTAGAGAASNAFQYHLDAEHAPDPIPKGTIDRRTHSSGVSPSSAASENAQSSNPYLQKLPPVLRRSVMGTGARQHAARNTA